MSNTNYKAYFDIDKEYFPVMDENIIKKHPDQWKKFYPHATFKKLLEVITAVLTRRYKQSIWVEGAYGTGKSHAVLTLKKLLDATKEDTEDYFTDYCLPKDLLAQFNTAKTAGGKLITVFRSGSAAISDERSLILAVQGSVEKALKEAGIQNQAGSTLRDSILKWLEDEDCRDMFKILAKRHAIVLGTDDVAKIESNLRSYEGDALIQYMNKVIEVAAKGNLQIGAAASVEYLCDWLREIIEVNELGGIVFIWDEFTEFFKNNRGRLTGLQTLAELSSTVPFYLVLVTHETGALLSDSELKSDEYKKIFNRFVSPRSALELPENIAFQLMGQALKRTGDTHLAAEYEDFVADLFGRTEKCRQQMQKTVKIADDELRRILPLHPYSALMLKHIARMYQANQRSMFSFICDSEEKKGFRWYIESTGPMDDNPFLSVDMLWNYFYEMGKSDFPNDVRQVLDTYNMHENQLEADEKRVLRVILLLQAVSMHSFGVDLFQPKDENLKMAFEGTDLEHREVSIAKKLVQDRVIFENKAKGIVIYSALVASGDADELAKHIDKVQNEPLHVVLETEQFLDALDLEDVLKLRYKELYATSVAKFDDMLRRAKNSACGEWVMKAVVCYALNDEEKDKLQSKITAAVKCGLDDIVLIDASTVTFADAGYDEYVEHKANASYFSGKDNGQAKTYEIYYKQNLDKWKDAIKKGQFLVYAGNNVEGERQANIQGLNDKLLELSLTKYPNGLEKYRVNATMWVPSNFASGAECGITQEVKGAFRSGNVNTKLENAIQDGWHVDGYWQKNPNSQIAKIKIAVDKLMKSRFDSEGRISICTIYNMLKQEPFGFMPCALTAFILGFVLKEYVNGVYTYSDGTVNEPLTKDKLKSMIDEVLKLENTENRRYKDKYIALLTPEEKKFNEATAKIFDIDEMYCSSVEKTRDYLRSKMQVYDFPIWVLKYVLDDVKHETSDYELEEIIEAYCKMVNTKISGEDGENMVASGIGRKCLEKPQIVEDMKNILNKENCRRGMQQYLSVIYREGELLHLAEKIVDKGQYLNEVKAKFSADAANWVWNRSTADEQIDSVILEYQIVDTSNDIIEKNTSFKDTVESWKEKCDHIRISYYALENYVKESPNFADFLKCLSMIKQNNNLPENEKKRFLELLREAGTSFSQFNNNQLQWFKRVGENYLDKDLQDEDIENIFKDIPERVWLQEKQLYLNSIVEVCQKYSSNKEFNKLRKFWKDKTGTLTPRDWINKFDMPILAMVPEKDYVEARRAFGILNSPRASKDAIADAKLYVQKITYFDDLENEVARDAAFRRRILRNYAPVLNDLNEVKAHLKERFGANVELWSESPDVEKEVRCMAEREYTKSGYQKVKSKIESLSDKQAKDYLAKLIEDNPLIGIEILQDGEK